MVWSEISVLISLSTSSGQVGLFFVVAVKRMSMEKATLWNSNIYTSVKDAMSMISELSIY